MKRESETIKVEQNYSHHSPPILTKRDFETCRAVTKWIRTARMEHSAGRSRGYGPDWLPSDVDFEKSRLFWRIRSGREPLPEAPPTAYSCPWYEVVEEADRAHWAYELWVRKTRVFIAQCGYDVEEWESPGVPRVVRFNCWRFRVWRGEKEVDTFRRGKAGKEKITGWWLERIHEDAVQP